MNMEYFRKLGYLTHFFKHPEVETPEVQEEISRIQSYAELSCKILCWEDPALTLSVFLVLNFLFWLAVLFELRILGIVFLSLLVLFISDFFFEKIHTQPLYSHYAETIHRIRNGFTTLRRRFKMWRDESHSSFCIVLSIEFLSLTFLAGNISGYILFYLLLLTIFFLPLAIIKMPPEYRNYIKNILAYFSPLGDFPAEDELVPILGERDPELESQLTDRTADSVTNSLISGISTMPSYLDADDIPNDLDEEDLIPSRTGVSYTPGNLSSESDSDHQDIHFDPTHFNGDSSSEEENLFGKGLKFGDKDAVDAVNTQKSPRGISDMLSDVAVSVGSRVVSTILQTSSANTPVRKNSSSDSEFEIIDRNEASEHK